MKSELYNAILDMDIDSVSVTGVFTKDEEVYSVIQRITKLANEEHRAECNKGDECFGLIPYMLKHLKIMLTSHEEYTSKEVLALVAGTFAIMGDRRAEIDEAKKRKFKGTPDAFLEMLKEKFGEENVEFHKVDLSDKKDEED